MKRFTLLRIVICCLFFLSLTGCGTLSGLTQVFTADNNPASSNQLSEIERAQQARLLAGKSSRPSLASLNLMPVARDFAAEADDAVQAEQNEETQAGQPNSLQGIPALSLAHKKAEYEALLPLIKDPVQRRQAAFRLADINMLLAEKALEEGLNAPLIAQQSTAVMSGEANLMTNQSAFMQAIASYQSLLEQHQVIEPNPQVPLSIEQQALNRKQMDAMYQLSRALDLAGQKSKSVELAKDFLSTFAVASFGITEQHVELYFRIGEYYFNRRAYADAADYYSMVLTSKAQTQLQNTADFYGISTYMLGWSEFKQDNYDDALHAFDLMLRHTLGEAPRLESETLDTIDSLAKGEMRLVRDSIRVMALTFSYQGSAKAIAEFYHERANSPYQHLIYEELAQQYLDEDRFGDSADALLVFAQNQPLHPRAVEFYIRHIDAFILGGFPDRVLLAKQGFVQTYSLGGEVLKRLDSPIGEAAVTYLKMYLTELAQTEHSIAQAIDAILQARTMQSQSSERQAGAFAQQDVMQGFVTAKLTDQQSNALRSASTTDLTSLRTEAYEQAIWYYENFIRTFTYAGGRYDEQVPQRRFYMAEAYMALNRFESAIAAFETYAYEDTPNPMAVEAAYAAILAYAQMSGAAKPEGMMAAQRETTYLQQDESLSNAQFSQQRFVLRFSSDRRTPVIALNLMQSLFNEGKFLPAQRWAKWLLEEAPSMHQLAVQQERSALLVMAHSEFELANFANAQSYYRDLLARPEYQKDVAQGHQAKDPKLNAASNRNDLIDRLAASLYKQAEQELSVIALTPADLAQQSNVYSMAISDVKRESITRAISFWQTILRDTPESTFRLAAQFDSASYYALLGQWQQAIDTWIDFAQRYPNHELTSTIEGQLLYAYQQTENWQAAAQILLTQWSGNKQSDAGREALYQAATLFDRAENRERALDAFRTYAHAYPQPLDLANEARFRLSEFYLESGEDSKRRFWLNKLLQAQLTLAGDEANSPASAGTVRSRYLAAMSAMVFASDADTVFKGIKLTLPLNKSLAKKQQALTAAIDAYDTVMSFAVAEFAAQANYHLANLYLQLSKDLMASSRPADLSALELSQYELLLEEQAYPFEETAIQLHEKNAARAFKGLYDSYVKQSFDMLSRMLPARYHKPEKSLGVSANDL